MYDVSRRAEQEHHPLTVWVLGFTSPLRAEVLQFVRGTALDKLPALERQLLLLRFIPLNERSIEAKHSLAKKNLQTSSRPSAAAVSLALRFEEILQKMENEERFVNTITDAFDSHRRNEQIIISTGLASHATMNGCIARESSLRRRDVALCFYHCDMESQFLRHNIVVHAKKKPKTGVRMCKPLCRS
jgi:hypothetical protein